MYPGAPYKAAILAHLLQHPSATVAEVDLAVYASDSVHACNKARAVLHQMKHDGSARHVSRSTEPGQWWAVREGGEPVPSVEVTGPTPENATGEMTKKRRVGK